MVMVLLARRGVERQGSEERWYTQTLKGTSPGFGVLRYEDREFRVPYTPMERLTLLGRLREMRHMMALGSRPPGQRDNCCTVCGYRSLCGF